MSKRDDGSTRGGRPTPGQPPATAPQPSVFVKESFRILNDRAAVHVDVSRPFRHYLRSAELVWKQGKIYESERDIPMAYIMYMRFIVLILTELKKHPEYKLEASKSEFTRLRQNCVGVMDKLEMMKPVLAKQFAAIEDANRAEIKKRQAQEEAAAAVAAAASLAAATTSMAATETLSAKTDLSQDGLGAGASTVDHGWWKATGDEKPILTGHAIVSQSQASHVTPAAPQSYQTLYGSANASTIQAQPVSLPLPIPVLPPPVPVSAQTIPFVLPPPVPVKPIHATPSAILQNNLDSPTDAMLFEGERRDGMRKLQVPRRLMTMFLTVADPNTRKNLETCGILCGKLSHNVFRVTTLLIPKQKATSDSCTTTHEEDIFAYQDRNELLTLGWIHTHPTQTCFMSSVDLHTHCSYQLMLPEAIAIVMAPSKDPSRGVFRLTDPPGIDVISSCRNPQMFHPHERHDGDLYEEIRGGHVEMVDGEVDVIDLR